MENAVSLDSNLPSSPPAAVFSDEVQRPSSPPSSPPGFPWEQSKPTLSREEAQSKPAENVFSVLGKRKALESISDNVQPKRRQLSKPRKSVAQNLTQMQISLGQEVSKKCKTCGMAFIQSSAEDRKLHDKYHKQNTEGYDVGKDFVQKARPHSAFAGARSGDTIFRLDCFDTATRKNRGQAVLEIVQRELGAVGIPEKAIWDPKECSVTSDAYWHVYLYVRGTKCIGFLLAQSIKEAYRVIEPAKLNAGPESQKRSSKTDAAKARAALKARQEAEARRLEDLSKRPIELSKHAEPTILGISRIWTSAAYRRQSIAHKLLDIACNAEKVEGSNQEDGFAKRRISPEKREYDLTEPLTTKQHDHDDIAFSQPTEAGTKLARSWFGKMFGWKVYID
jgi:N-acetyltransferase